MTIVNKTMQTKLNDIVRQINTFSADIHGYIANISFSNDAITNVCNCIVFISYLLINIRLAFIVNHGLLYIKMFILTGRFRKWLLRFLSNVLKVKVKGQRSTQ